MITLIKIVGKFTDLMARNLVYGGGLEEYLEWFYAINGYVMTVSLKLCRR